MDRFIVGTGRCGSTLLSRMLAECPSVVSVFEYLNGMDAARRFAPEPVSGAEFAALVCAEQPFLTAVMRRGYPVPEVIYPFGKGMRFRVGEALPWILANTLPRLFARPDERYDDAVAFLRARPAAPAVAHHRAFFGWLAERSGRGPWIERSGSSIDYLGALADAFPGARFLHIHRDGPEAALSMREHHAYRLPSGRRSRPPARRECASSAGRASPLARARRAARASGSSRSRCAAAALRGSARRSAP